MLDGVAAEITVNATWLSTTMIGLAVAITKPNGSETRFMFAWAWANLGSLASPIYFPDPFPQLARTRRRAVS